MVTIGRLWLPILVATVLVFIASSVVWMALPYHSSDTRRLPDEASALDPLRKQDLSPGLYRFPWADGMKAMKEPAFTEKLADAEPEQAERLDINIIEEFGTLALSSKSPAQLGERCTVFMERDLNHYLAEGWAPDDVLASVLHSVRENYLLKVGPPGRMGEVIFFQGATAKNRALVAAFEQRLQKPILVSKYCHLTGAMGTALSL